MSFILFKTRELANQSLNWRALGRFTPRSRQGDGQGWKRGCRAQGHPSAPRARLPAASPSRGVSEPLRARGTQRGQGTASWFYRCVGSSLIAAVSLTAGSRVRAAGTLPSVCPAADPRMPSATRGAGASVCPSSTQPQPRW